MPTTPAIFAALLIVDSLHFVFAKLLHAHISPSVSALYVLAIGTLEVALFGIATKKIHFSVLKQQLGFFLSIGGLIAVSTNLNYEAVAFIDPGVASLLSQSGTLFSLGISLVWLREKLNPVQIIGALIAIVGAFTITFQPGEFAIVGSLIVLGSAMLYSLHTAIAKRYGGDIDFVNFFFFRLLITSAFLLVFSVSRGALLWPSPTAWKLLVLVGTTDVVISRTLYYIALRRLKMSIHTIILALSPVAAILWTLLIFKDAPTLAEMTGGAAVIAGVVLVTQTKLAQPDEQNQHARISK
ncbi:MAG: DMT family transporter [Anaerolineae bacterium]|nr:DMT family transporter [Anaerolineae bacterium]